MRSALRCTARPDEIEAFAELILDGLRADIIGAFDC